MFEWFEWMKKHSCTSEKALPVHSLPKLLSWYTIANAGSSIAMRLPRAWTWHSTCVCVTCGSHLRGTTLCLHAQQPPPRREGCGTSAGMARPWSQLVSHLARLQSAS